MENKETLYPKGFICEALSREIHCLSLPGLPLNVNVGPLMKTQTPHCSPKER